MFLSARIVSLPISGVAESAASQTPLVVLGTKHGGCQDGAGGLQQAAEGGRNADIRAAALGDGAPGLRHALTQG